MKRFIAILLLGFLVGASQGDGMFGNNWMRGLFDSINQLNANIQGNVHRVNQEIQEGVRNHLARLDTLDKDVEKAIGTAGNQMITFGNGGSTILVNDAGGTSRTVLSGTSPNGQPYFRDIEERVIGDILHHTERVYNATTKVMDVYRYTLDLKDPKAKPVPVQS